MTLPFSTDELKDILKIDSGFNNILNSLPTQQAEQIRRFLTDDSILKNGLKSLPASYRDQALRILNDIVATPEKALRLYEQCRFFEARELLLKTIDLYTVQPSTSSEALHRSLEFVTKRLRALCYDLLGGVEHELGNTEKAGQYHQLALHLAEELEEKDQDTIAKAKLGLGAYFLEAGDFEKGMEYCNEALAHIDGLQDRWHVRQKILTTLSVLCSDINKDLDEALEYAHQAVELCERGNDRKALPICLNNLACLYMELQALEPAINALENGLEVAQDEKELRQEALILNNIAMCFLRGSPSQDEVEKASLCVDKALSNSEEISSPRLEALSLRNLGFVHQMMGRVSEARKAFLNAIKIYRRIGSKANEAMAMVNLGWHLKDYVNDTEGACQACRKAIDIIEEIRCSLKKETHRIGYADRQTDPYELIVDCLLSLDRPAEALEYVERAKSRALLDFLSGKIMGQVAIESDSEAFIKAVSLLGEIDEIRKNLEAIDRKTETDARSEDERGGRYDSGDLSESLIQELSEKERVFKQAFSELNRVDPERASMLRVSPVRAKQIQMLLDEETVFLELYQSEERLRMFVVTHDNAVKSMTVDLSCYEAAESVWDMVTGLRQKNTLDIRSHEFIRGVRKPLTEFFDLLIVPLKPLIDQYQRLIISPHLFWHYFPFQALYDKKEGNYLCDQFELGYCPSGSTLHFCQQKDRVARDRSLILSRNDGDLPYADKEADLVAGPFSPNCRVLKGKLAHLGQVSAKAADYDVVHLACHGQFNHEQPFLSGIDIPPEESDERRTYLLDLFHLRLDCSIVTLSACDSGLSRFTSADELIGLSRGLFYAGAASVMLSLWQVADESTCYLMENFYWHFVKNRQAKTRALQLAMQAVKARTEYAHPYYWAPFVVMGDWR